MWSINADVILLTFLLGFGSPFMRTAWGLMPVAGVEVRFVRFFLGLLPIVILCLLSVFPLGLWASQWHNSWIGHILMGSCLGIGTYALCIWLTARYGLHVAGRPCSNSASECTFDEAGAPGKKS